MSLIDPRYLGSFVTICRTGSFVRAARQLGRTQPAVSHQIRALEREIGAPLLERGVQRTIPTPVGRVLLATAERLFDELDAVRAGSRPVRLRVASVSGFGRYSLFPALVRRGLIDLCELLRYPTAPEVLAGVLSGDYDVGFVHTPPVTRHLRATRVALIEYVLVAPRSHPPLPRSPSGYGDLSWVTYDECDYVFGRWFDGILAAPPPRWRTRHHFEELEETLTMVASGAGVTIVPATVVAGRADVRVVRPGRRRVWNPVHAVQRATAPPSEPVARLLEAVAR
jgi:LysR family transcriptional regulator, cyn operon transcriptional activator